MRRWIPVAYKWLIIGHEADIGLRCETSKNARWSSQNSAGQHLLRFMTKIILYLKCFLYKTYLWSWHTIGRYVGWLDMILQEERQGSNTHFFKEPPNIPLVTCVSGQDRGPNLAHRPIGKAWDHRLLLHLSVTGNFLCTPWCTKIYSSSKKSH